MSVFREYSMLYPLWLLPVVPSFNPISRFIGVHRIIDDKRMPLDDVFTFETQLRNIK